MKDVEEILKKYENAKRDSLIPILQDIQDSVGYIPKEAVKAVGKYLNLPASKIYGVATFYNQFRFEPLGKYHIQICRGTACHVKGSQKVLETLQRELGIGPGETTKDGLFSIEVVACLGACGLAPVITVNDKVYANMDSDSVKKLIKELKKGENKK